jgi:hypothetical protein
MEYWITRSCRSCGSEDHIELTKEEAAFHLYDWKSVEQKACTVCGSTHCKSIAQHLVKLDLALLDQWGTNAQLRISDQDEHIILAEVDYLPIMLDAIDNQRYLPAKTNTLLEAVCVLLYDHVVNPFEYSPEENLKRSQVADSVRPELQKRKDLVRKASPGMMDYLKEVVFPEIGLTKDEK